MNLVMTVSVHPPCPTLHRDHATVKRRTRRAQMRQPRGGLGSLP